MSSAIIKCAYLFIVCFYAFNSAAVAAETDVTVVVRNVTLPDNDTPDTTVNVVIVNGILNSQRTPLSSKV